MAIHKHSILLPNVAVLINQVFKIQIYLCNVNIMLFND